MNDFPDEPPLSNHIRPWTRPKADDRHLATVSESAASKPNAKSERSVSKRHGVRRTPKLSTNAPNGQDNITQNEHAGHHQDTKQEGSPTADKTGDSNEESASIDQHDKLPVSTRFISETKRIIYSSWINWLLLFVPIGIAFGIMHKVKGDQSPISPTIIFAMNAIAIIPLASLLSFATESVATKLGDTIGALMNVTFGNAVELIIFIIALVAKEIRVVQASLLGSILANLLLILGMCFLFGGLRFREQLYNSAVSQMSACLLSLSVVSLLLPTAFHASFNNSDTADKVVLKVSRGTSVVLLFVYMLYLLFQLKSHAYMYESTPQHLIDEESHPGVLADMLNSSSSSDASSSSSDSDSDSSSGSHTTAKRIKRALRRKRRKSEASSKDTVSVPSMVRTPSSRTHNTTIDDQPRCESPARLTPAELRNFDPNISEDEGDTDGERMRPRSKSQVNGINFRDFENEKHEADSHVGKSKKKGSKMKKCKHSKKHKSENEKAVNRDTEIKQVVSDETIQSPTQVGFVSGVQEIPVTTYGTKRPFTLRNLSVRPTLPTTLVSARFIPQQWAGQSLPIPGTSPLHTRSMGAAGIRRTTSLPEILQRTISTPQPAPVSAQPLPHLMPANQSVVSVDSKDLIDGKKYLSRTSAVLLLVASTALVAVCAEFLVDSIDYLVENTGVSQAFIGLIILPIVGNAAEHVTAVTVASKNKMDLAIGVALGSSIQIALFVTPVIVLLGWALSTDMSLYFSLFETISLFASAFIVNYLMIDGRSNYLEGALLIAAYVIIAVAAFFYPGCENLSMASGPIDSTGAC